MIRIYPIRTTKNQWTIFFYSKHECTTDCEYMIISDISSPELIIEKIKEKYDIVEFFDSLRDNPKLLEEFVSKEEAKSLTKILSEKREKDKSVKRILVIKSFSPSGLLDIKSSLSVEGADIHYLGSSHFSISVTGKDFKEANNKLSSVLEEIKEHAKNKKIELEIKEK